MPTAGPYPHYCAVARALDRVGGRWTLLIVRDLLKGPRRFSELEALAGGVTRRQLAARLKQMEASGLVERDAEAGRRRVSYRLTASGRELAPVVRALTEWGARHAFGPPRDDELVHPEHLLHGAAVMLARAGAQPERPVVWRFVFPEHPPMALAWDGQRWRVRDAPDDADLQISASPRVLAGLVFEPQRAMALWGRGLDVRGDAGQLQLLLRAASAALGPRAPSPDEAAP